MSALVAASSQDQHLRSFEELTIALTECFAFFETQEVDGRQPTNVAARTTYLMELMKTFIPQQKELELFGLFDSCKPYTRNVIHDSTKFTMCLYCWNPGAESKIHDHPCDLCLVLPLSGSLKVERYDAMTMAIDNVRFYLEGQVATLSNANGVFRITNPRRYVSAMSLSLLSPSYRTHTTWVSPTAPPKLTRIGTFSIRGIRTPRLEARLGLHGQLLVELKERAVLIPADKNMRPDGHRGGEAGGGGSSSDDVLKAQSLVTKSGVYKLGEHVGRGAYGNVYQALNKTTGTFAAVKVIPAPYEDAESERHMAKILSEIQFLESCVHPNIVRYYEAIRFHNSFYIFTEFMESKSIQHILQQYGTFDESLTRTYLKQILSGLGYLHERGVIHRDVKGANVLVAKDGLVKLADFGVALQVRDEPNIADRTTVRSNGGKEPEVVGTPYWMAPEIILLTSCTTKSDIWSVGCTVCEMLDGSPPYFELAPLRAFYRIVNDSIPPLPRVASESCHSFLQRCFVKDPLARPCIGELKLHPWMSLSV